MFKRLSLDERNEQFPISPTTWEFAEAGNALSDISRAGSLKYFV